MIQGFVIPSYFTAIDRYSGPMAKMQRNTDAFAVSLAAAGGNAGRSMHAFNEWVPGVAANAGKLAVGTLLPLGLATASAVKFEKQMGNVATIVDTTKESMSAMGAQVLEVANKVPVAISDLTESLYQIRSAGVSAGQAMEVLYESAKLSVTGLSTATDATKAVTSAMVSFKAENLSTTQIANAFFLAVQQGKTKMDEINAGFGENAPLVATAGVKLQEYLGIMSGLTNLGLPAAEAQNAIKNQIHGLIAPTSAMQTLFAKFGVSGAHAGEALLQKFGGLENTLIAINDEAAKMNIAPAELFNRTALNAFGIEVGNQQQNIMNNIAAQMNAVNTVNDAFGKQMQTNAAKMELFRNQVERVGIEIGTALFPVLDKLVGVVKVVFWPVEVLTTKLGVLSDVFVTATAVVGIAAGGLWLYSKMLLLGKAVTFIATNATIAYNAVVLLLNASIGTQIILVGVLTGGILLLMGAISVYTTQSRIAGMTQEDLTTALNTNNDAWTKQKKVVSDAQLALERYNGAMERHNEMADFAKRLSYAYNKEGVMAGLEYSFLHPVLSYKMAHFEDMGTPDRDKYVTSDEQKEIEAESAAKGETGQAASVNNNIYVNVDKNGNVNTKGSNNNTNIITKATGRYQSVNFR